MRRSWKELEEGKKMIKKYIRESKLKRQIIPTLTETSMAALVCMHIMAQKNILYNNKASTHFFIKFPQFVRSEGLHTP